MNSTAVFALAFLSAAAANAGTWRVTVRDGVVQASFVNTGCAIEVDHQDIATRMSVDSCDARVSRIDGGYRVEVRNNNAPIFVERALVGDDLGIAEIDAVPESVVTAVGDVLALAHYDWDTEEFMQSDYDSTAVTITSYDHDLLELVDRPYFAPNQNQRLCGTNALDYDIFDGSALDLNDRFSFTLSGNGRRVHAFEDGLALCALE